MEAMRSDGLTLRWLHLFDDDHRELHPSPPSPGVLDCFRLHPAAGILIKTQDNIVPDKLKYPI
jgi:hypothetical protein